jgi:hypothetical protein
MPKVNPNEKKLLIVMGVALFILANFFGWVMISDAMDSVTREEKKLNARLKDLNEAKAFASEAAIKRAWIDENVKTYESEVARDTYLNDLLLGPLTSGLDLEITKNRPLTPLPTEFFYKSRYTANVKGPWNDVMEFIYRLQKPSALRFVPRIQLLPKKNEVDDSQQYVEASLEIEQWWANPDGTTTGEENPGNVEQPAAEPVNTPAGENPPPSSPDTAKPESTPAPAPASTPATNPALDIPPVKTPAPPKPNP